MARHLNQWRPDTCSCALNFAFDDEDSLVAHTWDSTIVACPEHIVLDNDGVNITDGPTLYAAVLEENQRKNVALGLILTLATVDREVMQDAHRWSFDSSTPRVVTISFGNRLPASELGAIRAAANLQFGSGLVVIER